MVSRANHVQSASVMVRPGQWVNSCPGANSSKKRP